MVPNGGIWGLVTIPLISGIIWKKIKAYKDGGRSESGALQCLRLLVTTLCDPVSVFPFHQQGRQITIKYTILSQI